MGSRRMMAALALVLCVMAFYTSPAVSGDRAQLTNGDFLRFHVIGNSDSEEDQALKLKVRDGLLAEIHRELTVHTMAQAEPVNGQVKLTQEQTRTFVEEHLEDIARTGEQIVRTLGYDYPVDARLEICQIPEKTYGNVIFPEGIYEALNVTIGEGEGKHWWCCLFPPLCLVGAEPLEEKYEPLLEAARSEKPVKLELRFKTLELIDSLTDSER